MLSISSHAYRPSVGIPGGRSCKEPTSQYKRLKRHSFEYWVGKIPRRRAWPPTPVFLPGESHGQRSLAGCSPRGQRRDWSDRAQRIGHLYVFFGETSAWVFLTLFNWVVGFDAVKCHELFVGLGDWSLLVSSLGNIFSQFVGYHFTVSFAVQTLVSLSRFHLFIVLGDGWKKLLLLCIQRVLCLCFPLGVL